MKQLVWIGVLAALMLPGCRRMRPQDPAAPHPWWKKVLNAPNEMYFDSRSHDIERNLERANGVSID